MKKIALALAATSFASAPAFAGVYVNTELNQGYTGSDYSKRAIDFHVGYTGSEEKTTFYIQGGPTVLATADVDGSETEISGKIGLKHKTTDNLALYSEFKGITNGDEDNKYNVKAGAKYSF